MNPNIEKFSAAVANDPALQSKLQAIHEDAAKVTAAKLAELSRETDAPFTAEEFLSSAREQAGELTEEQLSSVAGGKGKGPGPHPWFNPVSLIVACE